MEPSSYSDVIRRLRELGSFPDDETAIDALSASIRALGAVLSQAEQEALAGALPVELAQILQLPQPWSSSSRPDFFRTAAACHCVPTPLAIEHTAIVCRALGEILTPTARKRLAKAVPALARLVRSTEEPQQRAGDPHGETKLSKSCGLTQEREARTLANIHARSARPSSGRR